MSGRGVGRGVGRGITPTPVPVASPVNPPSAEEVPPPPETPRPIAVGRGRGLAIHTAAPVTSPVPTPAPAVPLTPVASVGGRGVRRQPQPETGGGDSAAATAPVGAPTPVVTAVPAPAIEVSKVTVKQTTPAVLPTPVAAIERRVEQIRIEDPAAPAAPKGDEPGRPARRADPLTGAEGALAEKTRREKELQVVAKPVGTVGRKVDILSNVVHFTAAQNAMVYEYRVDFYPQTWNGRLRLKLIQKIEEQFPGPYLFDNDNLFLARPLPRDEQDFIVDSPFSSGSQYKLSIRQVMTNRANESKELLNLIVKEIEIAMNYTQIGKNRYNSANRVALKEGTMPALEIWPGYQTSVNPFMGGVLLMTDAAFRVVRVGNVKQLMEQWRRSPMGLEKNVRDNLMGSIVLTPYNDKCYIVSEIMYDKHPTDTFDTAAGPITYIDYYKKQYNIDIQDHNQPLMFSRPNPTGSKKKDNRLIALVPELCQLTGIQDDLRSNFVAMKAITTTTKLSPPKRYDFIMEYLTSMVANPRAKTLMENWGIKIDTELLKMGGRVLPSESIQFRLNKGMVAVPPTGDWTRDATGGILLENRNLHNWTLIFNKRDSNTAESFFKSFRDIGRAFGMEIGEPKVVQLDDDRNITYVACVEKAVKEKKAEMVVFIFPGGGQGARDDRYAAVKKACYVVHGVASQCINQKTLSRPDRMHAIVQKIALQINCKLGGCLWRMGQFKPPVRKDEEAMRLMVVGVDAYHDLKRQRDSVTAMVASLDEDFTQWHSRCNFQPPKAEMGTGLAVSFMSALNAFVKHNKALPNTIVIFRDGLSDAELEFAVEYELPQITEVCRNPGQLLEHLHSGSDSKSSHGSDSGSSQEADYSPEIYFIVVQKRISQRLFLLEIDRAGKQSLSNPKPGTVVDEVITRRDMYDFYLVPQNVREGSVAPVHFVVCHQPLQPRLNVDLIQGLAYKLTHMYYNWTGTVRVPAPCMYAHKLAYQSGACYDKTEPKLEMADKLYFL